MWTPFWFEGNLWFGMVNSPEDWLKCRAAYDELGHGSDDLLDKAHVAPRCTTKAKYGLRSECNGEDTLRQFFERNNMQEPK